MSLRGLLSAMAPVGLPCVLIHCCSFLPALSCALFVSCVKERCARPWAAVFVVVVAARCSLLAGCGHLIITTTTRSRIHPSHAGSEHIHSSTTLISVSPNRCCCRCTPLPALIEGASAAPDGRRRAGLHPRLPHILDLRRHSHRICVRSSSARWAIFCLLRSSSCRSRSSRTIIGEQRVRVRLSGRQQRAGRSQYGAGWQWRGR